MINNTTFSGGSGPFGAKDDENPNTTPINPSQPSPDCIKLGIDARSKEHSVSWQVDAGHERAPCACSK
jgi:hypothetical protein